ncbi:hypothetical protein SDC9_78352 [bioreactor metagenome]|uniref:Uncharacterized protein n=1 Tax=bioreactor metagenome TaxID=1076179 RepID=A0A644YT98_9ZZZZ
MVREMTRCMDVAMAAALRWGAMQQQTGWIALTSAAARGDIQKVQDLLSRLSVWGRNFGTTPADRIAVVGIADALEEVASGRGKSLSLNWWTAYDSYGEGRHLRDASAADILRIIGARLYGDPGWQPQLADALGVREDSVRKWAAGAEIPRGVFADAFRLLAAHRNASS